MAVIRVTSFVASTYVADLDRSRRFYGSLGFIEQSTGSNDAASWSYLNNGDHFILLASSEPPLPIPRLPLLFYFFVADLSIAVTAVRELGVPVRHVGYPPHAPGGEAQTTDPDGNTILLGQAHQVDDGQRSEPDHTPHFSLLRESAALAHHRATATGAGIICQLYSTREQRCDQAAEIKLADAWGDSTWACLRHAEAVLIQAPGVFIASQEGQALRPYVTEHRPVGKISSPPSGA
jgi:catechol 2,3-dioxygenase-like lactoylglutathione lyase family enzyme